MIRLPSRQVHLDFHTSEHIPDVGARFDKQQWQEALRLGRLNSITVFAKCHHSWSYYPTQIGRVHPTLTCDLLGGQIEACHEIGVRAPIYYTIGWSSNDAEDHPEWWAREHDGSAAVCGVDMNAKPDDPRPPVSWIYLCPSGEYLGLMLEQTREICRMHEVDGFFYDICMHETCCCEGCRRVMRDAGLNADDEADVKRHNIDKWQKVMRQCNAIIHESYPDATVFYNGAASIDTTDYTADVTHLEFEDLPTAWGGYDKFPLRAKYFANSGKQYLAMSGKFHTYWGEFGGFKHPDAMRYEAAAMIAWGARCSFGDQLHPSGEMDLETYRSLGHAFEYVEQIEEYGLDGQPCANLGLWRCGAVSHDQGVANMLLETQTDFEVVDPAGDLSRYAAIVLTGQPCLNDEQAEKLRAFVAGGGGVLALGRGALDADGKRFVIDVGAKYLGPAEYEIDYLVAGDELAGDLVRSPFLCYEGALRSEVTDGQVLASIHEPYFNRTYARYCSHQNAPHQPTPAAHPGAIRQGNVIYLPHALGAMYHAHGARVHRQAFINALRLIHRQPMLDVSMPSAARVNLLHQPQHNRYVAHLLYGPGLQRGGCLVIEDLVPLHDVPVTVRLPQQIKAAYLAPQKQPLTVNNDSQTASVTVPEVRNHQAVVFEY